MAKPLLLALDDEKDNLDLIQRALRPDFEVITALSGKDALEQFSDKDFAVVLSDQKMPNMTGVEFLQESLKRQPGTVRILITGYSDIDSVIDAVNKGSIHRYIKKPWRKDELVREIKEAMQLQSLIGENKDMIHALKVANQKLEEQQAMLRKNLDERSKELFEANRHLTELNEVLKSQSMKDGLTGLYNHKAFQEKLRAELAASKENNLPVSLIFFDVDHFKQYNDKHGHQAGDELLKMVGMLLSKTSRVEHSQARNMDTIARYGGEEFAVILPNTPIEGALIKAERIRKMIHQHTFFGMETQPLGKITVSIGIATFPDDAKSAEELIELADQAMYASKRAGRNQVKRSRDTSSANENLTA